MVKNDLISRQAAIGAIRSLYPDMPKINFMNNFSNWEKENKQYIECERVIDSLPSVQSKPEEQRRGKWINEKINSYTSRTYCSECGNSAPFICVSGDHYGQNMHGEVKKTKFCPHCGADMREESDNEIPK